MLDNYQRAIIEKMQHSPRNLIQLAQLLKMIDERPGLAHYNYCGLLDIHEVTFYRNLKTLRTFGLVHPTKYKLNPKAELETTATTTTIEDNKFEKWFKSLPADSKVQRYVAAVAKNPTKEAVQEVRNLLRDNLNESDVRKFLDTFALFSLVYGWYDINKDKDSGDPVGLEDLREELARLFP